VLFLISFGTIHTVVGTPTTPSNHRTRTAGTRTRVSSSYLATTRDYLTRVPPRRDVLKSCSPASPARSATNAGSGEWGFGRFWGFGRWGSGGDWGSGDGGSKTKSPSRDHTIMVSAKRFFDHDHGQAKWTTVANMGCRTCVDGPAVGGFTTDDRNTTQLKFTTSDSTSPTSRCMEPTAKRKISQISFGRQP